ncbi:hypothetical protein U9M48_042683 [Paspalum notatum var. saurae]|uniref:Uncharacterized protein n=1 Tax=Paspalum notatum var. saurae TaxID=547442 RepID=A0AAQ3UVU0_PASNO
MVLLNKCGRKAEAAQRSTRRWLTRGRGAATEKAQDTGSGLLRGGTAIRWRHRRGGVPSLGLASISLASIPFGGLFSPL